MKALTKVSINTFIRTGFLILLAGLLFLSCGQDPIFYQISNEPEAKDPIIAGNPTNIVVCGNSLYAATRQGSTVYRYWGYGWIPIVAPGGSIGELASDGTNLYALVFPEGEPLSSSLICKYDGTKWTAPIINPSPGLYSIQTIYGAGGQIFAGAQLKTNYLQNAILWYNGTNLVDISPNTSMLKGVASDGTDYYLATMGNGIFKFSGGVLTPEAGTAGANMVGIINTGAAIAAVSSDGRFFSNSTSTRAFTSISAGLNFTGAMCMWNQYDKTGGVWEPKLLLLGTRGTGSSLTHGYREMVITQARLTVELENTSGAIVTVVAGDYSLLYGGQNYSVKVESDTDIPNGTDITLIFTAQTAGVKSNLPLVNDTVDLTDVSPVLTDLDGTFTAVANGLPAGGIKGPGDGSPTSIKNKSKYTASLGKHPVEAIIQAPQAILIYPNMAAYPFWEPPIFASTSKHGLWSYRGGVWNAEE